LRERSHSGKKKKGEELRVKHLEIIEGNLYKSPGRGGYPRAECKLRGEGVAGEQGPCAKALKKVRRNPNKAQQNGVQWRAKIGERGLKKKTGGGTQRGGEVLKASRKVSSNALKRRDEK